MISDYKYFISTILYSTSAEDTIAWQCRVVDTNYREIFNDIFITRSELKTFQEIMESDKEALLNRKHYNKSLARIADWKIDHQPKLTIKDGVKFP
jgi:hypothetical protein